MEIRRADGVCTFDMSARPAPFQWTDAEMERWRRTNPKRGDIKIICCHTGMVQRRAAYCGVCGVKLGGDKSERKPVESKT